MCKMRIELVLKIWNVYSQQTEESLIIVHINIPKIINKLGVPIELVSISVQSGYSFIDVQHYSAVYTLKC